MRKTLQTSLEEFRAGTCIRAFSFLGCHRETRHGQLGYVFRVWAPNARAVSVVGTFNFWNVTDLPMQMLSCGVWEAFSVYAQEGNEYKYYITRADGSPVYKADPYAFAAAQLPETSSKICTLAGYVWNDGRYCRARANRKPLQNPMNIYEVHLGSWRRRTGGGLLSYRELAGELVPYVQQMGYTHIELLPVMEHPYDPSWGYQVTGYYAPTARYGTPQDFMYFIDCCHQAGIGVILDWVPGHFPKDEHGLYEFDGTCCYELADPTMNEHAEWTTRIYDYGRGEVCSFLVSNAVFWLEQYHIDGLRVDAVASMLYLDYNRTQYKPNRYGGKENLDAIAFLQKLNQAAFQVRKNALMIAEESTAFPLVTKPDYVGGLGFLYKWNMGWMNDLLQYMSLDPLFRKGSHDKLTFQMTYAFSENFILPLSHDEVVHGKKSLIGRMPGEYDDKFHNLRVLFAYQMAQPGKKLNFMGNEFAQFIEWDYKKSLDWMLLDYDRHRQMQQFVRDLNHFYLDHAALWQDDEDWDGFQWICPDDASQSVLAFRRIDRRGRQMLVLCNFCPVLRTDYRIGVPRCGRYLPSFSTDDTAYGGTGTALSPVHSEPVPMHGYTDSAVFTLPPMSVTFYTVQAERRIHTTEKKQQ